jgi:hypothetical protein
LCSLRHWSWRSIDITTQSGGPTVRRSPPPGNPTVINFDTDTLGNAIPGGNVINNTYSSWGVTFAALTCESGVAPAQCLEPGGNVYAVAYPDANAGTSFPKGSAPNAVSTYPSSAQMMAQTGFIRATFATPQSQVTIVALQWYGAQSGQGSLPGTPVADSAYLDAYDVNGNRLCHTPVPPGTIGWQLLEVTSTCSSPPAPATIAYVQFALGHDASSNEQLLGEFDNLTS